MKSSVIFGLSLKHRPCALAESLQTSRPLRALVLLHNPAHILISTQCRVGKVVFCNPRGRKGRMEQDASQFFHMVGHRIEAAKGLAPHARFGGLLFARNLSTPHESVRPGHPDAPATGTMMRICWQRLSSAHSAYCHKKEMRLHEGSIWLYPPCCP